MTKRETYTHRPMQVSDDQMAANWERIFGNKNGLSSVHGSEEAASQEAGADPLQETDPPTSGP